MSDLTPEFSSQLLLFLGALSLAYSRPGLLNRPYSAHLKYRLNAESLLDVFLRKHSQTHKLRDCQNKPLLQTSHLLLAPSRRDVFNSTTSPSFNLPSPYLFIKTSHSAPAPLLFLNTLHFCSLSSILLVTTSHYCIQYACSASQIKRIAKQYLLFDPVLSPYIL
jgi:hypothetical protein